MSTPQRIQRKRTKGWRMPEGAVYVGRGSKWGNPFATRIPHGEGLQKVGVNKILAKQYQEWVEGASQAELIDKYPFIVKGLRGFYIAHIQDTHIKRPSVREIRSELRGKTLMCWCPIDAPCHADVLLALANGDTND